LRQGSSTSGIPCGSVHLQPASLAQSYVTVRALMWFTTTTTTILLGHPLPGPLLIDCAAEHTSAVGKEANNNNNTYCITAILHIWNAIIPKVLTDNPTLPPKQCKPFI